MKNGLCLSRKIGETLLIGDDVEVTVVGIRQGAVKLHIAAPKHLDIVRQEIRSRMTPIVPGDAEIADLGRRRSEFLEADEVVGF